MDTLPAIVAELVAIVPPSVVRGLRDEHGLSEQEAVSLAGEAVKFLAYSSRSEEMTVPSQEVDEAWHLWLLDSRAYFTLCDRLGVGYLHHEPGSPGDPVMLEAYRRTRSGMAATFGEVPDRWWADRSGAGGCTCTRRAEPASAVALEQHGTRL
jgi:hypothetical protein